MRPLAVKSVPREVIKNLAILSKSPKIFFWKNVPSNFIGLPQSNQQKQSALVIFYQTTTDKLQFTHWSQANRMFRCGEIAIS